MLTPEVKARMDRMLNPGVPEDILTTWSLMFSCHAGALYVLGESLEVPPMIDGRPNLALNTEMDSLDRYQLKQMGYRESEPGIDTLVTLDDRCRYDEFLHSMVLLERGVFDTALVPMITTLDSARDQWDRYARVRYWRKG